MNTNIECRMDLLYFRTDEKINEMKEQLMQLKIPHIELDETGVLFIKDDLFQHDNYFKFTKADINTIDKIDYIAYQLFSKEKEKTIYLIDIIYEPILK